MVSRWYGEQPDEPQNRIMTTHHQTCADKVVLLGEMLSTAKQYLIECFDAMDYEDRFMLGIAADGLPLVRLHCLELSKDLQRFQRRVRERVKSDWSTASASHQPIDSSR
jgi:hypothetical protein